jgi:hypothetical protein
VDDVVTDDTQLNGSIVVVQSDGRATTVDVETFPNFSTGTYQYVYVAQEGTNVSTEEGTVQITTPTATPTPTTPTPSPGDGGDGGGGGGGGQPGGGAAGEVEITGVTLVTETATTGSRVLVDVDLANYDPSRGTITLNLTADGEVVNSRTVGVGPSTQRTVSIGTRFGQPGTYQLAVNGVSAGSVTVTQEATETRTAGPTTPPPTTSPGMTPTATETPGGMTPTGTITEEPGSPTLPPGAGTPTGTEVVITFVLVLSLLAAVGVVVYVLPA